MPDAAKFEKLRMIKYRIHLTCGICEHGHFRDGAPFGECRKHKYVHGKHTGQPRGVSVHRSGACDDVSAKLTDVLVLGAHKEFVQGVIKLVEPEEEEVVGSARL